MASAGDRGQCHGASAIGVSVYTGAGELTSDNEGVTSDMWPRCPASNTFLTISLLSRPAADDKIDF